MSEKYDWNTRLMALELIQHLTVRDRAARLNVMRCAAELVDYIEYGLSGDSEQATGS